MIKHSGWVDLQVNGQIGVDFSSAALDRDGFLRAAEAVLTSGTALFLPTVITGSMAMYRRNLRLIADAVESAGLEKEIPGIHLEGPFLAPEPGYIGCHDPKFVQKPSPENFDALFDAACGKIKLLTLAASADSGDLIEHAVKLGVTVSVGHHNATPESLGFAARHGATALTHLGNGVPNFLPRHRNAIFAGLSADGLTAMAIADGHHLPAEVLKCFVRCKGAAKLVIVSDASPAAGLPPGRYNVLGNDAILEASGRLYNPEKQCLVGSASTLSKCMEFLAALELLSEKELVAVGRDNALALIGMKQPGGAVGKL
ncbi:MAG: hypothetical protein PHI85_01185 [Victivallaceae bacterium]|nr:hypothetical protein [Victivallaceae bacterium]